MRTERKSTNLLLWILQIAGAAMFIMAGSAKLRGAEPAVEMFQTIGLGQWFRYFTGALEVMGAIALVIPPLSALGALLLALIMAGAVVMHLFIIGGSPAMALFLLVAMTLIAWWRGGRLDDVRHPYQKEEAAA